MIDETRAFPLGALLTVVQDKLLCPIDEVGALLNWLTDDSVFTHQFGRAMEECRPWVLRQHPELAAVTGEEITRDNWRDCLDRYRARYGDTLTVRRIPRDDHARRDPVAEAAAMFGADRVIRLERPEL